MDPVDVVTRLWCDKYNPTKFSVQSLSLRACGTCGMCILWFYHVMQAFYVCGGFDQRIDVVLGSFVFYYHELAPCAAPSCDEMRREFLCQSDMGQSCRRSKRAVGRKKMSERDGKRRNLGMSVTSTGFPLCSRPIYFDALKATRNREDIFYTQIYDLNRLAAVAQRPVWSVMQAVSTRADYGPPFTYLKRTTACLGLYAILNKYPD